MVTVLPIFQKDGEIREVEIEVCAWNDQFMELRLPEGFQGPLILPRSLFAEPLNVTYTQKQTRP
jgi:hypothetical protein